MNITSRRGISAGVWCQKSHLAGSSPSRRGSRGVYRPCVQDTHPKVWSHGIEINRHTVEFSSNRRPDQSTPELPSRSAPTRRCRVFLLFLFLCLARFRAYQLFRVPAISCFSLYRFGNLFPLRCSRLYRNLPAASKSAVPSDFTATFHPGTGRPRHGRRLEGRRLSVLEVSSEDHPE